MRSLLRSIIALLTTTVVVSTVVIAPPISQIQPQGDEISRPGTTLPASIEKGYTAYQNALKRGITKASTFIVVDYTIPANKKRFFIIDKNKKIIYSTYCAHGVNSGSRTIFKSYSNKINSLQSSIGVFITKSFFTGKHGLSLEMSGLDGKWNDKAFVRRILIHKADYANGTKPGNSHGCFAIPTKEAYKIKEIGTGVLLVAYYPDKEWLENSKFLSN